MQKGRNVVCRSMPSIKRKVRATQGTAFSNGKPAATPGINVTENNRPCPRGTGKGEKAG